MTSRVYADEAAYGAYFPDASAPADLVRLLRLASKVVDQILLARVYDVDADGMPTNADDALSMEYATCAIAGEAHEQGTLTAGGTGQWETVKIGSVQLSNLQGASDSDQPIVLGLPVPAAAVLELANVGTFTVDSGGARDRLLFRVARVVTGGGTGGGFTEDPDDPGTFVVVGLTEDPDDPGTFN